MLNKFLVAIDRSQSSERVFDAAIAIAKAMGSSLMLLHVLTSEEEDFPLVLTMPTIAYFPIDGALIEEYQKQWHDYETLGIRLLQSYADKAMVAGVKAEFTQLSGNPGRQICDMAKNWGADLIVIGHRGYAGWHELLLGSVSNYVLHHAQCSIFTVKGQLEETLNVSQDRDVAMALSQSPSNPSTIDTFPPR